MRWFLLLALACSDTLPVDSSNAKIPAEIDTNDAGSMDTSGSSTVFHSIEEVAALSVPEMTGVRDALVHSTHGTAYLLDGEGTAIRSVLQTWIHPSGTFCIGGTLDEDGACRGGTPTTSGRMDSPQPTAAMCVDADSDELILVKEGGRRLEAIDVGRAGTDAYSLHTVVRRPKLPAQLSASGSYLGPCAVTAPGEVALTSADHRAIAVVSTESDARLVRSRLLQFEPAALAVWQRSIFALDATRSRVVELAVDSLEIVSDWPLPNPGRRLAVGPSGTVWAGLDAGSVVAIADGVPQTHRMDGVVEDLVAVDGAAWVLVRQDETKTLVLMGPDGVQDERVVDPGSLGLVRPGASGDVAVHGPTEDGSGVALAVFHARPDEDPLPPLHAFLFTTIEEPSAMNMGQACEGETGSFAVELSLVRSNANALSDLGIPVALAISDNFTQKAEECGKTGIFTELDAHGFDLGVLVHNRPCYHCTDGNSPANPDHCERSHPHWIQPMSPVACFPDDPDYCPPGDWDCYRAYMQPRVDLVKRNIPDGGTFIAGADRHRMWDHDWIRLYRESGFDLTMFGAVWAYDGIDANDPRGKDPAPWSNQDRTVPWALADIDHWSQDSPVSDLVYVPGMNPSTVKVAEQQASGLPMIEFFDHAGLVAYRPDDFEVSFQWLRSAVNHRQRDRVNAWYFHVHDIGTLNIRDRYGEAVMVDEDGAEGPGEPISVESMFRTHIDRINERYAVDGTVVWTDPVTVRRMVD